jgi:hypothetical protein
MFINRVKEKVFEKFAHNIKTKYVARIILWELINSLMLKLINVNEYNK